MENYSNKFETNLAFQRLKFLKGNITSLQSGYSESTSTSLSSINKSNTDVQNKKHLLPNSNTTPKVKKLSSIEEGPKIYKKNKLGTRDSFSYKANKTKNATMPIKPMIQKKTDPTDEFVNKATIQRRLTFDNHIFYIESIENDPLMSKNDEKSTSKFFNIEEILIFEKETMDIINCLTCNNPCYDECFDWWNFYFNSSFINKLDQYFIDSKSKEIIQLNSNIELLSIIICYDLCFNYNIFCKLSSCLKEIMVIHHLNLLLISNYILSKVVSPDNNQWVKRLSNILQSYNLLNKEVPNISKEINDNCINITNIQRVILKNYDEKSPLIDYLTYLFKKISVINVNDINKFFREKVFRIFNKNGSILASSTNQDDFIRKEVQAPYLNKESLKKYTLVLDLDETLIHFKVDPNDDSKGLLQLRPGLFEFLEQVGDYYEIVVFTSATQEYADPIIDEIEQNKIYFDYRLYREHTVIIENDFVKDISKLGRNLNKVIIVDNMPQSFSLQKENGIFIRPFWGKDHEDYALTDLMPILINIAKEGCDVRQGLKFYKDEIINKVTSNFFRKQICFENRLD